MRTLRLAALLVLAVATAGCQTQRSLTRQQFSSLGPVDAVVCTNQIAVQLDSGSVPPGRPGGSHEARFRALNERATEMVQQQAGYDFNTELLKAIQVGMATVDSTKVEVRPAVVTTGCSGPMRAEAYAQSTAGAVLVVAVQYRLRDGGGGSHVLSFSSRASIYSTTNALREARRKPDPRDPVADGNAIYDRSFDDDFRYGSQANLRTVLKRAAWNLATQLADDLNQR